MKINTSYNHSPVIASPSGSFEKITFEFQEDKKTGRLKKIITGKVNIYKLIQENSKLCGLDLVIAQLKAGDITGLDSSGGLYADEKDLPKTIHDAHNLALKSAEVYSKSKILQKIYKSPDAYINDLIENKVKDKVDNFYKTEKFRLDNEIKIAKEQANKKVLKEEEIIKPVEKPIENK